VGLVARAARQPPADRDRPHVRHGLGDQPEAVVEDLANDHAQLFNCKYLNYKGLGDSRETLMISHSSRPPKAPVPCASAIVAQQSRLTGIVQLEFSPTAATGRGDPLQVNIMDPKPDLGGLEQHELEQVLVRLEQPRFHARQIFQWIHKRGVTDFALMSDLPRDLRQRLSEEFRILTPQVLRKERSTDGTTKLLLRLSDGRQIESVFI